MLPPQSPHIWKPKKKMDALFVFFDVSPFPKGGKYHFQVPADNFWNIPPGLVPELLHALHSISRLTGLFQKKTKKCIKNTVALLHLPPLECRSYEFVQDWCNESMCFCWCLLKAEGMMRTSHPVYCPFPCFRNSVIKNLQLVTSDLFSYIIYIGAESRRTFSLIYTVSSFLWSTRRHMCSTWRPDRQRQTRPDTWG